MDADKSRPVRRQPPARGMRVPVRHQPPADPEREPVRRPRKLARPDLPAGPQRDVRDFLYDLHEKAGRPTLEDLAERTAEDDVLEGAPKKDLIHKMISRGGPASLNDLRAVARILARDCSQDEHVAAAQVAQLMDPPERPPARPLVSPRSAYLAQVRRIAPPQLVGREAELDELARFCLDEQTGPYVWWQARPWAGKSALLSTFVLHPPEQVRSRVQIVAFFITARLAAQDTRQAFTAVLGEQLAAMTGQQIPAVLDESLREAWLLDLLAQATEACRQRGVRLVLVVDGLDEDRGDTTGPHAHSIAGLLPADLPTGMRVIVAGRPNPPVPDDVPDWHPLRDPDIIRRLAASPAARDLQRLGQAEVKRLAAGTPVEQDLLGLVTAARGGLSGEDLQELTGVGLADIEDVLHNVAGRTFTRRTPQRAGKAGPLVYLLGHEELDAAARRYLGAPRLAGLRDQLHAWAERYRHPDNGRPAWPVGTPEYLLRGYPHMLRTTGDLPRLIALATDPARHDRMLDLTGGDAAALDEITASQDLVLNGSEPNLSAMLLLSIRRNSLSNRNRNIPISLPATLATFGQSVRAEALARSITDPYARARALAAVVGVVAAGGELDRTRQLAASAETVASSITDPYSRAQALAVVAGVLAVAGDLDRARQLAAGAETAAHSITAPYSRVQALAEVAGALAAAGDLDRAEVVARSITDPHWQAQALAVVAGVLAAAGDLDRARQLAAGAETAAHSITDPHWQARALAEVAGAVAAAGDHDRAEVVARSITDPHWQAQALAVVAGVLAAAGDLDRARQLAAGAETAAHSTTHQFLQAKALAAVAGAVAAAGDHDRAEVVARSITDPHWQAQALTTVAGAVAAAGDHDRAEVVARSITDPHWQAQALTTVAGTVAAAGDHDRAGQIAASAEVSARSITNSYTQNATLITVAGAVAAGDHDRAEVVARSITEPHWQAQALTTVAGAVAAAGDHDRAEVVARSITDPHWQAQALTTVAGTVAAAGDHDRAEVVARSLTDRCQQAQALTTVAGAVAAAGDHDRAEVVARSITYRDWQAQALAAVAGAIAAAGDHDRAGQVAAGAEAVARSITHSYAQAQSQALAAAAGAVAAAGDLDRAERVATSAETSARSITDPDTQAQALTTVAGAIAATGDHDRAEVMARSITNPQWQAQALARVAEAIAATGDHDRAEVMARSITDPHWQAQTLAAVAGAIAAARDQDRAAHILSAVLAEGSWETMLPVLIEHWPHVVLRFTDELSGNVRSRCTPPGSDDG